MGFKVLGSLQAASANFPVLLNQELTVHTPDGLALSSGKRGEPGTGRCLMTEAEFQSLHLYPEASDKPWVSPQMCGYFLPAAVEARLRSIRSV